MQNQMDDLRHYFDGASQISSLSESFSIFVWEAFKKQLANADLRVLLWKGVLNSSPLNGSPNEHHSRIRLDQHRIARDFQTWAEHHLQARELFRHSRDTWIFPDRPGAKPYVLHGAGLDAESLGLVASDDLHFPQEITDFDQVARLKEQFDQVWNDDSVSQPITDHIAEAAKALYRDNAPDDVYLRILTTLFDDFLNETGDDIRGRRNTGFYDSVVWSKLYKFQKDGVLGAIEKLERYGGCIIADSVGLGKTFEALAVIKYYELRNDRALVIVPKRLRENWTMYRANEVRNPLAADRFNYDVLNHTDLSRTDGMSGDINLSHINWGNYDLVVIDESHNFRNNPPVTGRVTRYQRLMDEVIRAGVKTKVLMLSATPVNTRLADLKNQVLFATEGDDSALAPHGIDSIEQTLRRAQARFNDWQRQDPDSRSTRALVGTLGLDYIRLLDLITIARSRRHIEKYYDDPAVGQFPTRLPPINLTPPIDVIGELIELDEINKQILMLNLAAYKPVSYVFDRLKPKYAAQYDQKVKSGDSTFRQTDREDNVVHLIRVNLLKRLESSASSLASTLQKLLNRVNDSIGRIDIYDQREVDATFFDGVDDRGKQSGDLADDIDDDSAEEIIEAGNVKVQLGDIDRRRWRQDLEEDRDVLSALLKEVKAVDVERDAKLAELKAYLEMKASDAKQRGNPKALVFTAFADTAEYLYENLAEWAKEHLGIETALVTGQRCKSTLKLPKTNMLNVLTAFSPKSKGGDPDEPQIDLIIATDAISEGQNLQDCDTVINYDIHWNPVRIVQRFGRVDRLGSINNSVQLVNFWPPIDLESYINLERRVSSRMALLDVSATGEENLIDPATASEMNDLDYRRRQLEQMQAAAPTMEDLAGGLSITDITLSDFRQDAASRPSEQLEKINRWPLALFGVTKIDEKLKADGVKPGAIFLLKARNDRVHFADRYPLAPYFLAYVTNDGEMPHLIQEPKFALDVLRTHAATATAPDPEVMAKFAQATKNGKAMGRYRELLDVAIKAATGRSDENTVASLFTAGPSTVGTGGSNIGLDDFEVIAWLAIIP